MTVHLSCFTAPRAAGNAEAYCCMGAVMRGPEHCTCWEPIYDLDQAPALQEGPPIVRAKCCEDCAYRNGSPERTDEEWEDLDLVGIAHDAARRFMCHQGVRRVIAFRHPDGREVPADGPGDYRPPSVGDRIWRADGRPGELCAGWAAYRRTAA